jgi:hypothetical protein
MVKLLQMHKAMTPTSASSAHVVVCGVRKEVAGVSVDPSRLKSAIVEYVKLPAAKLHVGDRSNNLTKDTALVLVLGAPRRGSKILPMAGDLKIPVEYVNPELIELLGRENVGSPVVPADPTPAAPARASTAGAGAGAAGGSGTPIGAVLKARIKKVNAYLRDNNKLVCVKCGNDLTCRVSSRGGHGVMIGCKGYRGSQQFSCHNMMTVEAEMYA